MYLRTHDTAPKLDTKQHQSVVTQPIAEDIQPSVFTSINYTNKLLKPTIGSGNSPRQLKQNLPYFTVPNSAWTLPWQWGKRLPVSNGAIGYPSKISPNQRQDCFGCLRKHGTKENLQTGHWIRWCSSVRYHYRSVGLQVFERIKTAWK